MTDRIDVEERLQRAGTAFRDQPIPQVAVTWPTTPARRRLIAPAVIAATVALVIAAVTIGFHIRRDAAPASPAKPTPTPAIPAAPDPSFAVVAPPIPYGRGIDDRTFEGGCSLGTLRLSAQTRVTAEGVVGVITMTDHDCSITIDPSSISLLDAAGNPLKVPAAKPSSVNLPYALTSYNFGSPTVGINVGAGEKIVDTTARIGYAWTGTYCGPPAAAVALNIGGHEITGPLTGPGLACRWRPQSQLVPGTLAGLGSPVVPAPLSWSALRARLVLPPTFAPGPIPVVVVLTNTGHTPVALSNPCPSAVSFGTLRSGDGVSGFGGQSGDLCDRPRVIAPGKSLTLRMPSIDFPTTRIFPQLHVRPGDLLTVTWSIAGVPTATATTHIR